MMSNANNPCGDRGLVPNPPNLPQTGSQFLNCVKTEPGLFNPPSTSNGNFRAPPSTSNFSNCHIKTEPGYSRNVPSSSYSLPVYVFKNNKKSKKRKNSSHNHQHNPKVKPQSKGCEANALPDNVLENVKFKDENPCKRKADDSFNDNQKNSKIKLEPDDCEVEPLRNDSANELKEDEKSLQLETDELSDDGASELKEDEKSLQLETDELPDDGASELKEDEKSLQLKTDALSIDDSNDSEICCNPNEWLIYGAYEYTWHKCEAILDIQFIPPKEHLPPDFTYDLLTLLKGNLPPYIMKSVYESDNDFHNVKNYEWEKLVDDRCVKRIDNNMKETIDSILLPENEYKRIFNEMIRCLNSIFKRPEFENHWCCFGPYLRGLAYGGSVDHFYIESFPFDSVPQAIYHKYETLSSCCNDFGLIKRQMQSIHTNDSKTGKEIQISFSNSIEVRCSLLQKLFLSLNPNLKYLIVYVELILRKYRLDEKKCIFPSETVFWLIVFFMQQKNLLPAVADVRKAAQVLHFVSGWDCSIPENYSYPTEPVSLYSLLLGFFNFYKNFDFLNYVICPYLGRVLPLEDIEQLRLCADEFSVYLRQMRNPDQSTFAEDFLNLQDPTDLSRNLGCLGKKSSRYLNAFKIICHSLSELLPTCLAEMQQMECLCRILPVSIDVANYQARDFTKYWNLDFRLRSLYKEKFNQGHVIEAIRRLMEFGFKLERKSITIIQNCTEVKVDKSNESATRVTFPVIHFEYCSTENTWRNDYMKEIIPREEPIRIHLRCEVRLQTNKIRIFAQSNAVFIDFLKFKFFDMFRSVLNQMFST